jgi:hypothetical protein
MLAAGGGRAEVEVNLRATVMSLSVVVALALGTVGVLAATRSAAPEPAAAAGQGRLPLPGHPAPSSLGAPPSLVDGAVGSGGSGSPATPKPPPAAPPSKPAAPAAPSLLPPGAPTSLRATPGEGLARLCWEPGARAGGYVIYQRDASAGEAWKRLPYPVTATCWTGGLLVNGHTYQYRLRSGNAAGESGYSNTASVTPRGVKPGPPTNLTATPAGSARARLCWQPGPHATGYAVFVRDVTAGAAWTRLPYPVAGPCWTGGLLVDGHRYAFKLRSGNAFGESGDSGTALVTPHA